METIQLTKEKSMEMRMYEEEKQAQSKAFIALADSIGQGSVKKGIDLALEIARCGEFLKRLSKENEAAANEEYLELSAMAEGKPFNRNGFKLEKNAGIKKYTFVGKTGQEIKSLEKEAKTINDKISILKAGAKKTGVGVKIELPEVNVKFKLKIIAPKEKPAC